MHETSEAFSGHTLALAECLRCASMEADDPISEESLSSAPAPPSPRWPTSIPALDRMLGGGFYGLTALSGPFGSGKSLLAVATAVEAVRAGWLVVYFNAEMPRSAMNNRIIAYAGPKGLGELDDRFQLRMISPGVTIKGLFLEMLLAFAYWPDAPRILGVFDSINTIAEMALGSGDSYFDVLRDLGQGAMQARKHSEGGCAFLYVSEQNARGELKGLKLQYTADVVVNLKPTEVREQWEIDVAKSRESESRSLGIHQRDWHQGRFYPLIGTPVQRDRYATEDEIL